VRGREGGGEREAEASENYTHAPAAMFAASQGEDRAYVRLEMAKRSCFPELSLG
jgi:hypothetical protein